MNDDSYLFKHAVLQDAAYQLQPPSLRSSLHCHALDVLAQEGAPPAAELARHARKARAGAEASALPGLHATELKWLQRGIAEADKHSRHLDAVELLSRLVELQAGDVDAQAITRSRLVEYLIDAGRVDEAMSRATEALHDASTVVARAEANRALGLACRDGIRNAESVTYLRAAVDAYRELGTGPGLIRSLMALSAGLWVNGNLAEAHALNAEAEAGSHLVDEPDFRPRLRLNRAGLLISMEQFDSARALLTELNVELRESGNPTLRMRLHAFNGYALSTMGRNAEARSEYPLAMELARELGSQIEFARCLTNLAYVDEQERQFLMAEQRHQEAERVAREIGDMRIVAYAIGGRAGVAMMLGDLRSALPLLHDAARLAGQLDVHELKGRMLVLAALIHAEFGDAATARTMLADANPMDSSSVALKLAVLARLHHRDGDHEQARRLAIELSHVDELQRDTSDELARTGLSAARQLASAE